ncbi:MAG: hypothetical protein V3T48_02935 [Vicinamibacterales bacterium]
MTRIVTALVAVALLALAPIAFAQDASELDVSEAEPFMGMWSLSFESGQGPLDYSLDLKDMDGKVAATLNSDFFGESMVTDITKDGDDLTLKWEGDMQGQVIPLTLTLTPDGDGLTAMLDFAGMTQMDGTVTR